MRRKLICIFFMLAGIAAFTGTILLSRGRFEDADLSPVFTLLILSIVTISAAARHIKNKPNEPEVEASGRDMVFLRAIRAVGILAMLACLGFIVVMFFMARYYRDWMRNGFYLMVLAVAGITAADLSLKVRPHITGRDIAKAVVALTITAALGFVYLIYMPKYKPYDGLDFLRSDRGLAQMDVFYPNAVYNRNSISFRDQREHERYIELFGDNPFCDAFFQYQYASYSYDADGLHYTAGYIDFDSVTGAYVYTHWGNYDKTYSPGDWPDFNNRDILGDYPELNWNFMCDKNGKHDAVLNLFFRDWQSLARYTDWGNQTFTASSGEWDLMMKDVMYPHNFPEDEARAFLQSLDEETLKTKCYEQITFYNVKTIEIFFFGINIGTYQNGEIVLKP